MDFDGLEDVLEDTAYVPSFAIENKKSVGYKGPKSISYKQEQTSVKGNDAAPSPVIDKRTKTKFSELEEPSYKKPTTFEDFFSKNDAQVSNKPEPRTLLKNESQSNLGFKSQLMRGSSEEDSFGGYSVKRTNSKPIHDREETQSVSIIQRRNQMKPPLSRKINRKQQTDSVISHDLTQTSKFVFNAGNNRNEDIDPLNGVLFNERSQMPGKTTLLNKQDSFNPIEDLDREQTKKVKQFLQNQLQIERKQMKGLLEQERVSHKREIDRVNQVHREELIKKMELKDYELQKVKQLFEIQTIFRQQKDKDGRELSQTSEKIEENLRELKRIEQKISKEYSTFTGIRKQDKIHEMERKEAALDIKSKQLHSYEQKIIQMEADLKSDKQRFHHDQDRQNTRLDDLNRKVSQKQAELQAKYRAKQRDLNDEYQRKRNQMNYQNEKMRQQSLQLLQNKNRQAESQKHLKKRMQEFEERQKTMLQELHRDKSRVLEKQLEISMRVNDLALKESEIDMQRSELSNKLKIIELERKKIQIQNSGKGRLSLTGHTDKGENLNLTGTGIDSKANRFQPPTSNYQSYYKSISEMRDDMLKALPRFED